MSWVGLSLLMRLVFSRLNLRHVLKLSYIRAVSKSNPVSNIMIVSIKLIINWSCSYSMYIYGLLFIDSLVIRYAVIAWTCAISVASVYHWFSSLCSLVLCCELSCCVCVVYVCVCLNLHIYIYIYVYTHTYIAWNYRYRYMYVHIYIYIYIHTYNVYSVLTVF